MGGHAASRKGAFKWRMNLPPGPLSRQGGRIPVFFAHTEVGTAPTPPEAPVVVRSAGARSISALSRARQGLRTSRRMSSISLISRSKRFSMSEDWPEPGGVPRPGPGGPPGGPRKSPPGRRGDSGALSVLGACAGRRRCQVVPRNQIHHDRQDRQNRHVRLGPGLEDWGGALRRTDRCWVSCRPPVGVAAVAEPSACRHAHLSPGRGWPGP